LFESKRRKNHFATYAGGLAAAACVALVFMRYNSATTVGGELAQAETRPAIVRPATEVVAVAAPVKTVDPVIGPVNLRLNATTPDYSAMLAAMREQDEERAFANGHFQLNPPARSLFDDGMFNPAPAAPPQNSRLFRIQQTPAQQAEFTAFQFQR
jgi:hypothetical protein